MNMGTQYSSRQYFEPFASLFDYFTILVYLLTLKQTRIPCQPALYYKGTIHKTNA